MTLNGRSSFVPLLALGFALALGNLALVGAVRRVEADADHTLRAKTQHSYLPPGTVFTPLRGYDAAGKPLDVSFPDASGRMTVIVVFTPSCLSSTLLWPEWRRKLAKLPTAQFRVVAVDPLSRATADFVGADRGYPSETIVSPQAEGVLANRLRATPQMILLDVTGRVLGTWTGAGQITALTSLAGFSF